MPNQLAISGAQSARPVRYAPIYNARQTTGLWTQRNPLRDAASSREEERYYGGRNDALIDGANVEISNRLTFVRRPGSSVYNSQTFTTINSYYPFRLFDSTSETIKVIVDLANAIYDGTGPTTKQLIASKGATNWTAYFQSVGNTLYIGGNPAGGSKWVQSAIVWQASTAFKAGQFIIDPAGNIQTVTVAGTSGTTQPSWNATHHGNTTDGTITWNNFAPALEQWGVTPPSNAPTVSPVAAGTPTGYVVWTPSAYYSTTGRGTNTDVVILDSNGNIQRLLGATGEPETGASVPTWNVTLGGTTADGTITWINQGAAGWTSSHAYAANDVVVGSDGTNNYFFRCTTAGTSGLFAPAWTPNLYQTLSDNTVIWTNIGVSSGWTDIGATTFVIGQNGVIDSNGNFQGIYVSGVSGASQPTWAELQGGTTPDNTAIWINQGPYAPASTGVWKYVYSFKNSVTGAVSSASPASLPIAQNVGQNELVTGDSSTEQQVDTIVLFRTVQGGSVYFELAEFANPASGSWTYVDSTPDIDLNNLIIAPINHENDVPPAGLGIMTYHLGRVWGAVNNSVYFSGGPDTTTGNGNEAFPPANVFVFPAKVNRLFPCTLGLLVFTLSDIYLIQGTKTEDFFSVPFMTGIGLQSYFAFDVNGAVIYLYTTDRQLISLDMSAGASEVGFPIGDLLQAGAFNPGTTYVTWHVSGSSDKGLYVSDGTNGWFRLYPTPAPEHGMTWAPFALITGGVSAVQSIEASPGIHQLLIGPRSSGPILKRDRTLFTDNGQTYHAFVTIGSIVLAQPGQLAELVFITMDSVVTGSRPSVYIQLDEISQTFPGNFEQLPSFVPDPPQLAASTTIWGDRYYVSNTHLPALCRHMQIRLDWGVQTVQNEMLSLTAFGGYSQEL